jgi:uncharacterized protein
MEALAILRTEHASKYLTQLCKQFAHRIEVTYEGHHGECRFVCGATVLEAKEGELLITTISPDETQMMETQSIVERHLVRFAFRETIERLKWQPWNGAHRIG